MKAQRGAGIAIAAAVALTMTACGGGEGPTDAASSEAGRPPQAVTMAPQPGAPGSDPSSATSAAEPVATDGPGVAAAASTVTKAAHTYLQGRENQSSWYQETPTSWVTKTAAVLDPALRAELEKEPAAGGDALWDMAHEKGLAVTVISDCEAIDAAGPPTDTWQMLQCSVIDRPVGRDGKPVPTTQIPPQWQLVGTQQVATLEMAKVKGQWVLKRDWTGQAS